MLGLRTVLGLAARRELLRVVKSGLLGLMSCKASRASPDHGEPDRFAACQRLSALPNGVWGNDNLASRLGVSFFGLANDLARVPIEGDGTQTGVRPSVS